MKFNNLILLISKTIATLASVGAVFSVTNSAMAIGFTRAEDAPTEFHDIIDEFQQFANTESSALDLSEIGAKTIDATKLTLNYTQDVNVYFINEGAWFRNQLTASSTGTTEFNQMVFDDITCITDCAYPGYRQVGGRRFGTPDGNPLEIGDYFNLGTVEAGSTLDFSLISNGYRKRGTQTFSTDTSKNADGLQHLIAYDYKNYLVLAWEDTFRGGDLDYNDVVFVVDVGRANINEIADVPTAATPEPYHWVGGIFALGLGWKLQHYKNKIRTTK